MTKQVTKENCVACKKETFVGDVGEVLNYLCKKHKKEYCKDWTKIIKLSLKHKYPLKGTIIKIKERKYKQINLPHL